MSVNRLLRKRCGAKRKNASASKPRKRRGIKRKSVNALRPKKKLDMKRKSVSALRPKKKLVVKRKNASDLKPKKRHATKRKKVSEQKLRCNKKKLLKRQVKSQWEKLFQAKFLMEFFMRQVPNRQLLKTV